METATESGKIAGEEGLNWNLEFGIWNLGGGGCKVWYTIS